MRPCASVAGTRCTRCTPDLELQPGEHAAARDRGDRLLVRRRCRSRESSMTSKRQPLLGGIALVHAEQIGGEQRRLVAAGAGADFQDGVALVGRVLRQQHDASRSRSSSRQALLRGAASSSAIAFMSGIGGHRLGVLQFASRPCAHSPIASTSGPSSEYSFDTATNFCESRLPAPTGWPASSAWRRGDLVEFRAATPSSNLSAFSAPARASSATSRCSPLSRSRSCATPLASSSSPRISAARASSLLARCMRRFMLPR